MADSIVVATSIPPALARLNAGREFGEDYQRLCIRSWIDCGFRVLSVNDASEIPALAARHPEVAFVPASGNASAITGRKNPYLAGLLAALIDAPEPVLGIVNSDILFEPSPVWREQLSGLVGKAVVSAQRFDVHALRDGALRRYYWGYDVFFFDRAMAQTLAKSAAPFAMGLPWWDYWLPAATAFADRTFQIVEQPIVLHLVHPRGYDGGSASLFEAAFAQFVVDAAAAWSKPLSPDLTELVGLCREWIDKQTANNAADGPAPPRLETFAEQFVPWRRGLLENAMRLDNGEQPADAPEAQIFRDLENRMRAGAALDGAKYFETQGKYDDAGRFFQSALNLTPADFGALLEFGEFLCRFGDPRLACALLNAARMQQPRSAKVLNTLGFALRAAGNREGAIANFQNALDADPEFQDGYYNLAVTLFEAGRARESVACLDAALAKWPGAEDLERMHRHFSGALQREATK